MRKFLFFILAALLSVGSGWADAIKVSTNTTNPENVYVVHCACANETYYWSSAGAPVNIINAVDAANAAKFAFFAGENEGDYYIYSIDASKFVSYDKANIGNKRDFSTNVEGIENANVWKFTAGVKNGVSYYDIQPYNSNNEVAPFYVNWNGGVVNYTHTSLGLWQDKGSADPGSTWAIVSASPDSPDSPEYPDYIVSGKNYYITVNSNSSWDNYFGGEGNYTSYTVSNNISNATKFSVNYYGVNKEDASNPKMYTITDNTCHKLLAYTTINSAPSSVVPLVGDNSDYSNNTTWTFKPKTITKSDGSKTTGFVVFPWTTSKNAWNKHTETLGLWGDYNAASVAVFVPADVEAMNDLLSVVKGLDYVSETVPAVGSLYRRSASAFLNQSDYTVYNFETAKQLVEAYYEEPKLISTVNYTLTDGAGTIYTGTVSGVANERIFLTGAEGATFANENWTNNGNDYSATISFDFPVSSANTKNYTYIGVASSNEHLLFAQSGDADAYNVKCNYNENTINNMTSATTGAFEWAIYPSCTDGVFTFTIQNRLTGKYINITSGGKDAHCPLRDSGYGYAYDYCVGTGKGFHLPGENQFISINSLVANDQNLFVWEKSGTSHQGSNLAFFTPIDFGALIGELFNLWSSAAFYNNPVIGKALGEYTQSQSYEEPASYTTYKEAIVKAQEIVTAQDVSTYTYSVFTTTKSTLTNFNISDVIDAGLTLNMPSAGKFYRFYGFGHMLRDGNYYYMTAGEAGKTLKSDTLTSSRDNGNRSIFYLTKGNNLLAYYNGLFCNAATMLAVGGNKGVYTIDATPANIIANPERGVKSIGTYRIYHGTNYLVDWANGNVIQDNCSNANNDWIGWKIEEVTELPVTIPSITGGLATLYAPVALTLPANVYAYVATLSKDGSRLSLTKISGSVIPANTGVLLRSMETLSENKVYNFGISSEAGESVTSVLTGDIATTEMAGGKNYYSLQTKNSTDAGFYKKASGNLSGFKAYLTTATGSNGFVFSFADDDLTGVAEIPQSTLNDNVYRDILGRKVENPVKGQIYIVNGRTVRF